jgi:GNAT superfamily N-acetyltransferase
MSYRVREFEVDRPGDPERLADMFNDFDSAWPGGFNRGVPDTAETIREQVQRNRRLARYIVEYEDEFAGYCDLTTWEGQSDLSYIDLLGARLSHHGKGVGKILLLAALRRATELGFKQVTLHTWGGNLKAVPLYKKTGFHWVPETDVFMRNFIPTLLNMPVGKAFFEGRDWYACHIRELDVAPDDHKWKGMKTYPYRFRDGDDFLNIIIDSASEAPTAIETPQFSISCSIPVEEAAAGEEYPIVWEIENRMGEPLEVILLSEADAGLEVRVHERLRVTGEQMVSRRMRVSPEATPRREGEVAHRVRSTLLINGEPVTLETGVRVARPVEILYGGQGVLTGREQRVAVTLRNRLDRDLSGELSFDSHNELAFQEASRPFSLPAKSWTECEYTLTANKPGTHHSTLRCEAEGVSLARPVAFRAFNGTRPSVSLDTQEEMAYLETPGIRVRVELRGGTVHLEDPQDGKELINQGFARIGPPYSSWFLRPPLYAARLEEANDLPSITLLAESQEFPGVTLERSISLLGDETVRVEYRVRNATAGDIRAGLRIASDNPLREYLTVPAPAGLLRERLQGWGAFPQSETDILPSGSHLTENWTCCEEDRRVGGLVWTEEMQSDFGWSRSPSLTFAERIFPARSQTVLPPIYLIGGYGDWTRVRGWWRRLIQKAGVREESAPETHRVLMAGVHPPVILLSAETGEATLEIRNRRAAVLKGGLQLKSGAIQVEPQEFALEGVDRDKPFQTALKVTMPGELRAGYLEAELSHDYTQERFRLPVVRIGGAGSVSVIEASEGMFDVNNGLLAFRVCPGFAGSVTRLMSQGVEHLLTAYPQARPFVWANPWFGGIHPFIEWMGSARLLREKFRGGVCERTGEHGLIWQGVQVVCEPEHKDLRWLRLEVEYLTIPGSNVLALVTRWINRASARMSVPESGGVGAWCRVGGSRERSRLHWERLGERRFLDFGGYGMEVFSDQWIELENRDRQESLLLIATGAQGKTMGLDFGEEGSHLQAYSSIELGPGERKERLFWLVLNRDMALREAYTELSGITILP